MILVILAAAVVLIIVVRLRPAASKWPFVLVGMVAAGSLALFLWARTMLNQLDAKVIESACVGLFIGAVVGFVIRIVRYSKALPTLVAAGASEASVPAASEPQVGDADAPSDVAVALRKLVDLRGQGLITESDYAAKKDEILARL
jgi:hypothetical protein